MDYAEDQAMSRKQMHMADWVKKLDGFLQFNEKTKSLNDREQIFMVYLVSLDLCPVQIWSLPHKLGK